MLASIGAKVGKATPAGVPTAMEHGQLAERTRAEGIERCDRRVEASRKTSSEGGPRIEG